MSLNVELRKGFNSISVGVSYLLLGKRVFILSSGLPRMVQPGVLANCLNRSAP